MFALIYIKKIFLRINDVYLCVVSAPELEK